MVGLSVQFNDFDIIGLRLGLVNRLRSGGARKLLVCTSLSFSLLNALNYRTCFSSLYIFPVFWGSNSVKSEVSSPPASSLFPIVESGSNEKIAPGFKNSVVDFLLLCVFLPSLRNVPAVVLEEPPLLKRGLFRLERESCESRRPSLLFFMLACLLELTGRYLCYGLCNDW